MLPRVYEGMRTPEESIATIDRRRLAEAVDRLITSDKSRRYFPEEPDHQTFRDLPDTLEPSTQLAH